MQTNHIGFNSVRKYSLFKMHLQLMIFLNQNMQIYIAKGIKVSLINNILNLNFLIEKKMMEFMPLENIMYVVKSWMEILQLQKASINNQ